LYRNIRLAAHSRYLFDMIPQSTLNCKCFAHLRIFSYNNTLKKAHCSRSFSDTHHSQFLCTCYHGNTRLVFRNPCRKSKIRADYLIDTLYDCYIPSCNSIWKLNFKMLWFH
jgi:hypothetical protein